MELEVENAQLRRLISDSTLERPSQTNATRSNPMLGPMHGATRCGAKTRRGTACQSPAVRGKRRCRMHGGAPGSGAPSGRRNGNYRHGHFTAEAKERRRRLGSLIREARKMVTSLV